MTTTVILSGARTPFGRFNSALSSVPAIDLAGTAIRGAVRKSGLAPADIDYVVMGQVLQAGNGQNPARLAAVAGGIAMDVPALTINKVCLSGLEAIALADQLIRAGECSAVVAGGMESMSRAPHLLTGSRSGLPYGTAPLIDHLAHDGLHDAFTNTAMGPLTESVNDGIGISRAEQDAFAVLSHQRAGAASASGIFTEEIEPVVIRGRRGETTVSTDEGIRPDTTSESLAKLSPAFRSDGTITAGTSSPISDGAAAVVVMDRVEAERRGLDWIAEIQGNSTIAGPDSTLQDKPARAVDAACRRAGIGLDKLALIEINEAFAVVGIASSRLLNLGADVLNVNGGAIALGHPIGATGARIALHLALELRRRGGGTGAAALCGGGGQGQAIILHARKT